MLPIFEVRALGIVEDEDVIVPSGCAHVGVIGALLACIAAVAKFRIVTLTAPGTWNS